MFAGTFAPRGWALCDGQLLDIQRYQVLFSLLGTTYGGDGRASFALPDLRGRVPLHAGAGEGLQPRRLGEAMGAERVGLEESQMPAHAHELIAANRPADSDRPGRAMLAQAKGYAGEAGNGGGTGPTAAMAVEAISVTGRGEPHENMPPGLCLNFIIALEGNYPSRD
nr:tail fiber protein [Paracoccus salsus]